MCMVTPSLLTAGGLRDNRCFAVHQRLKFKQVVASLCKCAANLPCMTWLFLPGAIRAVGWQRGP